MAKSFTDYVQTVIVKKGLTGLFQCPEHNWLSFFVIPLSSNQTTAKKEEKAEYENHTHFKYDSQININHWPTDGKDIHHVRKSS